MYDALCILCILPHVLYIMTHILYAHCPIYCIYIVTFFVHINVYIFLLCTLQNLLVFYFNWFICFLKQSLQVLKCSIKQQTTLKLQRPKPLYLLISYLHGLRDIDIEKQRIFF
jgi:hypothetical protein